MHRQMLLQLLATHPAADPAEQAMLSQTLAFVGAQPDCFSRTLLCGHVTGSAWVVVPDGSRVVLLHHRKLNRWFQPGGHADGHPDVAAVALREAQEETGLTSLKLVSPAIFDVDVHSIPARGHEPAHLHYDIRFLVVADPAEPFAESAESTAVKWVTLGKVGQYNNTASVGRLVQKTRWPGLL